MANSAAVMQSQFSTLKKIGKEMHVRKTRKAFKSDKALSGVEVERMVEQEQFEARIAEALRPQYENLHNEELAYDI